MKTIRYFRQTVRLSDFRLAARLEVYITLTVRELSAGEFLGVTRNDGEARNLRDEVSDLRE